MPTTCPSGMILRTGYRRKPYKRSSGVKVHSSYVSPACIPAKGRALITGKKGKKLFKLRKGTLTTFGYSAYESERSRHSALNRAIRHGKKTPLEVFRKLNAVALVTKNTVPYVSKTFLEDRNWVRRKYRIGKHWMD